MHSSAMSARSIILAAGEGDRFQYRRVAGTLVGGQWQRDEPIASRDPIGERQIFDLLATFAKEKSSPSPFTATTRSGRWTPTTETAGA